VVSWLVDVIVETCASNPAVNLGFHRERARNGVKAIEAYESKRWPNGKMARGKG
jgi:hypothetical protein